MHKTNDMRKYLTLSIFLACFHLPFQGFSTNIGGNIASDSILTLANSPYIVVSTLTVNNAVTLTVQSGVELRFNSGTGLTVYGALSATNAIFTSNDASPVNGSWSNISFGDGSTIGASAITGSSFSWGSYFYINNNYTVNLTGSTVTKFSGNPLYVNQGAAANLNNVTISNSNAGVSVNGTVNFSNNSLVNNTGGSNSAILLNGGNLTLANTNITNSVNAITINSPSTLNISGSTDLSVNTTPKIIVNFNYLSTGTFSLPYANVPYFFLYGFDVANGATFTVANNSILKFQGGTGLEVNGIFSANATAGQSIFFTSWKDDNWGGDSNGDAGATSPARNDWTGIKFNDNSIDGSCILRRAQIRYAGNGVETNNASPAIDLCQFSINRFGLSMYGASNPAVTANTFASSFVTPIAMSFEADPVFTNNVFSFSDNKYDAIGLNGGTLTANGTLKQRSVTGIPNATYVLLQTTYVPVGITLTIDPGIVIKTIPQGENPLYGNSTANIQVWGSLIANGNLANPIVFTSVKDDNYGNPFDTNKDGTATSPAVGDFGSITMLPGSTGSSFNYCKIRYANGDNGYINNVLDQYEFSGASLNFINAAGTVQNCEIKDVSDGINCFLAANPTIQNNQFTNMGFAVTLSAAANPVFIGNTLTNVTYTALGLVGVGFGTSELAVSGTISQKNFAGYNNITYVLRSYLIIANGATVNIAAGIVIKSLGFGFIVRGGFKTDGTLANKVVFSSLKDDNVGNPADTNGDGNGSSPQQGQGPCVYFGPSSDDAYCKLNYLKNYFGGGVPTGFCGVKIGCYQVSNTITGVIAIESANPIIDQVLLSNLSSSTEGIGIYGNSTPAISNVAFQNGAFFPISMSLVSNPVFSNITFTGMGFSAILINDQNLTSNATLVTRNIAGFTNIAYVLNQKLTINSGSILTISPGVVIKVTGTNQYYYISSIVVNGALVVNGNAGNKVIFTDIRDDSAGGDSNNDGNTTTPERSWRGISFEAESVDAINSIAYAEIRFTGTYCVYLANGYDNESVRFNNSGGTINQVSIIFGNAGLGAFGTANPDFQNISLQNLDAPVRMDMFASPTFGTITANNIAVMGIHIPEATYSQTATFPLRNFAGYSNITYVLEALQTINGGTTITIPAGMTFKNSFTYYNTNWWYYNSTKGSFVVSGRLNINGNAGNPVVFTTLEDDQFGNPADIQSNGNSAVPAMHDNYWLYFPDIADDNSTIDYAVFRYAAAGIKCLSSSPTITNCTVSKSVNGIYLSGVSSPALNTNTFNDLSNTPLLTSILSYPSSTLNNIINGTTWKGIGILNETLSQDITLPKRNFGGIINIPYSFYNGFTIGSTATLTIAPGVVTKWGGNNPNTALVVQKALNAQGGFRADSNIVFTSYRDDFYGGDMNSDSTATSPVYFSDPSYNAGYYDWQGIQFQDISIDPLCKLKNCFIRFAGTGITTVNASPDIQKTSFFSSYTAVSAGGSSNPIINYCDFYRISNFGVNNVNQSFTINAENNWWGSNSGPTHSANPGGTGVKVTDAVDYMPFKNDGPNEPVAGDVSQNGLVQAYDASLILQYLVSAIPLTPMQQMVGDVSGNGSLSALDASYILQYSVGLISNFLAETYNTPAGVNNVSFSIGHADAMPDSLVKLPLRLENVNRLLGSVAKISFDTTYLEFEKITFENTGMTTAINSPVSGIILISMAGAKPLTADVTIACLYLKIKKNTPVGTAIPLVVEKFQGNENDLTALSVNGMVKVLGIVPPTTGIGENTIRLSPNPAAGNLKITIENARLNNPFVVFITNASGQKFYHRSISNPGNGRDAVVINTDVGYYPPGIYFLSIQSDGRIITKKFSIAR
jgi:parallel beta-helix repeat protein